MRVVAFAFLTPFFFVKGGINVSAHALLANLGVLVRLNAGIIDWAQFSLLVAVVVLSAIVPTAIAQRCFQPRGDRGRASAVCPISGAGPARGAGLTSAERHTWASTPSSG